MAKLQIWSPSCEDLIKTLPVASTEYDESQVSSLMMTYNLLDIEGVSNSFMDDFLSKIKDTSTRDSRNISRLQKAIGETFKRMGFGDYLSEVPIDPFDSRAIDLVVTDDHSEQKKKYYIEIDGPSHNCGPQLSKVNSSTLLRDRINKRLLEKIETTEHEIRYSTIV